MTDRPDPRYFTLDEANRTLPLVRRIVTDIVELYPEVQRKLATLRRLARMEEAPELSRRMEDLRDRLEADSDALNGYLDELSRIGCQFKGFEDGLVDFHAWLEGRPVLLCWKLGEDEIAWWHELDGGYAGRRPLTPEVVEQL